MLLGIESVEGPIDERWVYINTKCLQCNKTGYHSVTLETYELLCSPNRPNLQQILPDWTPDQREELISGTCPSCWNKMWSEQSC